MRTLVVDTNAYIQLRNLGKLPWRELLPGVKHFAIMVAGLAVEELDRFKVNTKSRLRDCRAWHSRLSTRPPDPMRRP